MTLLMGVSSCRLIDYDFDEPLMPAYEMALDRDTIYVMVGDTFALIPTFTPEIERDGSVYWTVEDSSVVEAYNNRFIATAMGDSYVTATSVIQGLQDSCYVIVMPHWVVEPYAHSDQMIIYATVGINGYYFNPKNMMIAAFVGDECRGVGELKTFGEERYVQLRIYGEMLDEDGNPEVVRFRVYMHEDDNIVCEYLSTSIFFDGETHGTLSEPVNLIYSEEE